MGQVEGTETLVVYTPEQITDECEKVLNMCLVSRPEGELLFRLVQIIRQLQEENAKLSEIVQVFQET